MARSWDVRKAKRILFQNPREQVKFNPKHAEQVLGMIWTGGNMEQVNIKDPVILITSIVLDKESHFPIDGWHRIKKAIEQGVEQLPAYILTLEESKEVEY